MLGVFMLILNYYLSITTLDIGLSQRLSIAVKNYFSIFIHNCYNL